MTGSSVRNERPSREVTSPPNDNYDNYESADDNNPNDEWGDVIDAFEWM
jgi:hypothetical protein